MAKTIHLDIVSAEGEIFAGEAQMVFVPAKEGELGISPRHAPLLTLIKSGEVRIKTAEAEQSIFVGGGALEIQPHKITILADTAIRAKDIDEAAALAAKQRAEEALAGNIDKLEQAEALAELVRASEQLKILEKLRKIKG
jgi:F-type H+-transporting ATPase subunit epsilon